MQGESAHTESGQFYGVQQGHLGHAIGFCATTGPVLVTLNLQRETHTQRYQLQYLFHSLLSGISIDEEDHEHKWRSEEEFKSCRFTHPLTERALLWIKTPGGVDRNTMVAPLAFEEHNYADWTAVIRHRKSILFAQIHQPDTNPACILP